MHRRRPTATALSCTVVVAAALTSCTGTGDDDPTVDTLRVEVVTTHPHDSSAFTQGLEIDDGELLEGTGIEGASRVSARNLVDGSERVRVDLPDDMFGEGITVAGDTVWQLTWRDGVAFARDRGSLTEQRRVSYTGEGWGLCAQPDRLVMSDGSADLVFRDLGSFEEIGRVTVRRGGREVPRLNELECTDDGAVYANVWKSDEIVRIDPESGRVTAVVDAAELAGRIPADERAGIDVLNGIAHIPGTDRFLLTGKYWPVLFEVRFVQ
ncbi:glutaminyl-peptide cyclotransferase [Rhodococcus yananensis]|uniref:glutaminyl-peptide cyclotransferase n=1 Tax=Rhodococcus yananensis TaxID=2879464 RepID=UPI003EBE8272